MKSRETIENEFADQQVKFGGDTGHILLSVWLDVRDLLISIDKKLGGKKK